MVARHLYLQRSRWIGIGSVIKGNLNMNSIVLVACGVAALVSLASAIIGVSVTRGVHRNSQNTVVRPPYRRDSTPTVEAVRTEESALEV